MRERFGTTLVAKVLKGSQDRRIREMGFDSLPTYGLLRKESEKEIVNTINYLIAEGYLTLSEGQYPVVKLTYTAIAVLEGRQKVQRKVDVKRSAEYSDKPNQALFDELRKLRKQISEMEKVPPFIIFQDSTLREMSERTPLDEEAMLRIKGMGEAKFRKYGQRFLDFILQFVQRQYGSSAHFPGNVSTGVENDSELITGSPYDSDPVQITPSFDDEQDVPSHMISYELFYRQRMSVHDIAKQREMSPITIQNHILRSADEGNPLDWERVIPAELEEVILSKVNEVGTAKLKPIKESLPAEVEYFSISAVIVKHGLK
jgi:ATP-dependent DNA helicase RecQ